MNGSLLVISQLLLSCLSDPSSMLSIQPEILSCVESLFSLFVVLINIFYAILKSPAGFSNDYIVAMSRLLTWLVDMVRHKFQLEKPRIGSVRLDFHG